MITTVTVSSRGQIVIPQKFRKVFGIEKSDKLIVELDEDKLTMKPVLSIDEAFGIVKTKKKFSENDYDKAISKAVIEKFLDK